MDTKKIALAKTSEVPIGESIIVQGPHGIEIALFNLDGHFYALDNACPHKGGPLGEGKIKECTVTCPWHAWEFNILTGECLNIPGEDALKIPLEVCDGIIYLANNNILS